MANKKITDLQLISVVADDLNLPGDNGVQTYRCTALQIKNYVLATGNVKTATIEDGAVTMAKLAAAVQALLIPTGVVMASAMATAPTGFLICNGAAVSRTTYAALWAALGVTHGQGDGSTTFNLPDYRGRFLRGVDGGAGRDPGSRTAMATGGNTGDNVGSIQSDAFQGHLHSYLKGLVDGSGSSDGVIGANYGGGTGGRTGAILTPETEAAYGTVRKSTETRPANANVHWIIKT